MTNIEAMNDEKNFYKTLNKLQKEMQHQKSSEFKVMSQTVFNARQHKVDAINDSEYLEEEMGGTKKDSQTNTVLRGARDTMQKTDLYQTVFETEHMLMKNAGEGISQGDISIKKSQSKSPNTRRESVTLQNKSHYMTT